MHHRGRSFGIPKFSSSVVHCLCGKIFFAIFYATKFRDCQNKRDKEGVSASFAPFLFECSFQFLLENDAQKRRSRDRSDKTQLLEPYLYLSKDLLFFAGRASKVRLVFKRRKNAMRTKIHGRKNNHSNNTFSCQKSLAAWQAEAPQARQQKHKIPTKSEKEGPAIFSKSA